MNVGGVCIYVRSNINFQLCADLSPNNLECLTVEISKPLSKPFLVSTWYRPPQSSPVHFSTFERIIDKIDAENLELYLMGDLNCNLLSEVVSNNSSHLLFIYGLTPLITDGRFMPTAPYKRTQHCWPTTPNIVRCYMLRPFAQPVACYGMLLPKV